MSLLAVGGIFSRQCVEVQYEWKVVNFFSLPEDMVDSCDTLDFEFHERIFNFRLYPNLWKSGLMLDLVLKTPGPSIIIQYAFDFKTTASEVRRSGFLRLPVATGTSLRIRIHRSELKNWSNELLPCNDLTISISLKSGVSLSNRGTTDVAVQTCLEDIIDQDGNGGHRTPEKTDFATFCRHIEEVKGKDCDVTLEVRGTKFRVHKLILESRTPVLAAMFSDNTAEAETAVVCVEDCHPEPFEVFLRFVYSGVAENLTIDNAVDVYYVANKYDLPRLKKECVRHMLSNLTTGSVCRVIDMAHRHGEELLKERATEFLVENAREIFKTPVWRKFTEENSLAYDLYTRVHKNWKYY